MTTKRMIIGRTLAALGIVLFIAGIGFFHRRLVWFVQDVHARWGRCYVYRQHNWMVR